METLESHKFSYSIGWCLQSEKYLSKVKRSKFAGGGPIMVSKVSDKIEMSGSAPSEDWILDFETKIRGLESYYVLEFEFKKEHLSKYKSILNLNSIELLKMSKSNPIISIEKSELELGEIKDDFDKCGIESSILRKERKLNR